MFCSNCGNRITDNSVFCPFCGYKLQNNLIQTNLTSADGIKTDAQKSVTPKKSGKGLIAAIIALAIVAVVAIAFAVFALMSVLGPKETSGTNENNITAAEESISKEDDISHLNDEEQVPILIKRHISYVANKEADKFVDSLWECIVVDSNDEFIDDDDFVRGISLYYFGAEVKEIKNIEILPCEFEELNQDQRNEMREYAEELMEEYNVTITETEATRSCGSLAICDVVYEDGSEGQVEIGFLLYKFNGKWKMYIP